jgi:hypothetical protein
MAATAACDNEKGGARNWAGAGLNDAGAHGSAAMTILYYISEDKSDMRGIKPGWYGMEDDGNLSSGPFSSRQECLSIDTQEASGLIPSKLCPRPN